RGEEMPAGHVALEFVETIHRDTPRYLFKNSSKFINWVASIVHAASFVGSSFGSGFDSPAAISFFASSGLSRLNVGSFLIDSRQRSISSLPKLRLNRRLPMPWRTQFRLSWPCHSRAAKFRAASTNCGSFSVTSACSGVLVRSRRTAQVSRLGALKMSIDAGGAA